MSRYQLDRNNDRVRCDDELFDEIPHEFPPRYFRYVEGRTHFLVQRRDDGYTAAVYDATRVRDNIIRDPLGWELSCLEANRHIDQWLAYERGTQARFWLFYLPFLHWMEYAHHRLDYGGYTVYELRDAQGHSLFECDINECIQHWDNVRTDQWSGDAQQRVTNFLRCARSADGWTNEWYNQLQRPPNNGNNGADGADRAQPHPALPTMDDDNNRDDEQSDIPDNISDTSTLADNAFYNDADDHSEASASTDDSELYRDDGAYFIQYPIADDPTEPTIVYSRTPTPEIEYIPNSDDEQLPQPSNPHKRSATFQGKFGEIIRDVDDATTGLVDITGPDNYGEREYREEVVCFILSYGQPRFWGWNQRQNERCARLYEEGRLLLRVQEPQT